MKIRTHLRLAATTSWCGVSGSLDLTSDPADVDCRLCLRSVAKRRRETVAELIADLERQLACAEEACYDLERQLQAVTA